MIEPATLVIVMGPASCIVPTDILMANWLYFWRRGRSIAKEWATAHPWLSLIVASLGASTMGKAFGAAFEIPFPALSYAIDTTIRRSMPIFFYGSGIFLILVLVVLIGMRLSGTPVVNASQGAQPTERRFAITIAIIAACAGVAFLDAYLSGAARHSIDSLGR